MVTLLLVLGPGLMPRKWLSRWLARYLTGASPFILCGLNLMTLHVLSKGVPMIIWVVWVQLMLDLLGFFGPSIREFRCPPGLEVGICKMLSATALLLGVLQARGMATLAYLNPFL